MKWLEHDSSLRQIFIHPPGPSDDLRGQWKDNLIIRRNIMPDIRHSSKGNKESQWHYFGSNRRNDKKTKRKHNNNVKIDMEIHKIEIVLLCSGRVAGWRMDAGKMKSRERQMCFCGPHPNLS